MFGIFHKTLTNLPFRTPFLTAQSGYYHSISIASIKVRNIRYQNHIGLTIFHTHSRISNYIEDMNQYQIR